MTPERILGNMLGKAGGVSRGRDANLHGMGDLDLGIIGFVSHIPQSLPTTLGAAMAFKMRSEARVAVTFVGDGSTTAGAFHETLNMAALWNAPYVLIIENNQYAYSTPLRQQTAVEDLASKAEVHGVATRTIDGNDIEGVRTAVSEAVERARSGGGPSAIETITMRMRGHAVHDGAEYVPQNLLAEWEERDPLVVFRRRLIERGDASSKELDMIDAECRAIIDGVVAEVQGWPMPDPSTLADGLYA
jgi:pyruvate dehydrogenase E1 component alpha subunit